MAVAFCFKMILHCFNNTEVWALWRKVCVCFWHHCHAGKLNPFPIRCCPDGVTSGKHNSVNFDQIPTPVAEIQHQNMTELPPCFIGGSEHSLSCLSADLVLKYSVREWFEPDFFKSRLITHITPHSCYWFSVQFQYFGVPQPFLSVFLL